VAAAYFLSDSLGVALLPGMAILYIWKRREPMAPLNKWFQHTRLVHYGLLAVLMILLPPIMWLIFAVLLIVILFFVLATGRVSIWHS